MATEKKETAQRDENGVRKQSYKRFKEGRDYEPTDAAVVPGYYLVCYNQKKLLIL